MSFRMLVVIPARSGSKGLRGKNIRRIDGKPLLVHAIELAMKSRRRGEDWTIAVSTDSRKYAGLATKSGALVPELRPRPLAKDSARLIDVVFYALGAMEQAHGGFDCVSMLTPTTPLTRVSDFRRGVKAFKKTGVESVVSVVHDPLHPSWQFSLKNGRLQKNGFARVERRQKTLAPYRLNGAFYLAEPEWLRANGQFLGGGQSVPVVMPKSRSLDIETADDLASAAHLYQRRKKRD